MSFRMNACIPVQRLEHSRYQSNSRQGQQLRKVLFHTNRSLLTQCRQTSLKFLGRFVPWESGVEVVKIDPNRYSLCEVGLLLYPQYDSVQIVYTASSDWDTIFDFRQACHAHPLGGWHCCS